MATVTLVHRPPADPPKGAKGAERRKKKKRKSCAATSVGAGEGGEAQAKNQGAASSEVKAGGHEWKVPLLRLAACSPVFATMLSGQKWIESAAKRVEMPEDPEAIEAFVKLVMFPAEGSFVALAENLEVTPKLAALLDKYCCGAHFLPTEVGVAVVRSLFALDPIQPVEHRWSDKKLRLIRFDMRNRMNKDNFYNAVSKLRVTTVRDLLAKEYQHLGDIDDY